MPKARNMRRIVGKLLTFSCASCSAFIQPAAHRCLAPWAFFSGSRGPTALPVSYVDETVPSSAVTTPSPVKAKYKKLQNQSDIRGISMPGVPGESVTLGPVEAFCIGLGFGQWLKETQPGGTWPKVVSVGRDPRLSGPELASALMGGLAAAGGVISCDVGPCSTPAMFKSCVTPNFNFNGAIMVTASHLPANRNGFKFFTPEGGLGNADIGRVVSLAAAVHGENGPPPQVKRAPPDALRTADFLPEYAEQLKEVIRSGVGASEGSLPLAGLKVVVNPGNGMGGFLCTALAELGADTTGSFHLQPDGTFPNHLANPELPEAMEPTVAAVRAHKADIGIVLDTDVDRSGLVDASGRVLNRNRLLAAAAALVLREHPGTAIVTDSTTSNGLAKFVEAHGGKHIRYKKGYKNVIDKAIELNNEGEECWLAMETSGHAAFKENDMLDDGAYLAIKLLVELARTRKAAASSQTKSGSSSSSSSSSSSDASASSNAAGGSSSSDAAASSNAAAAGSDTAAAAAKTCGFDALTAGLSEPKEETEFRLRVRGDLDPSAVYEKTLEALREAAGRLDAWMPEAVNHEGLRVIVDEGDGRSGWLMNRLSLHDPIVIFNAESEVTGGVAAIARNIYEDVLEPAGLAECLDCSKLLERFADLKASS